MSVDFVDVSGGVLDLSGDVVDVPGDVVDVSLGFRSPMRQPLKHKSSSGDIPPLIISKDSSNLSLEATISYIFIFLIFYFCTMFLR